MLNLPRKCSVTELYSNPYVHFVLFIYLIFNFWNKVFLSFPDWFWIHSVVYTCCERTVQSFFFSLLSSWDYGPVPLGLDINNDLFLDVLSGFNPVKCPRQRGNLFWKWEQSTGGGKFTDCPVLLRVNDCEAHGWVCSFVLLSSRQGCGLWVRDWEAHAKNKGSDLRVTLREYDKL